MGRRVREIEVTSIESNDESVLVDNGNMWLEYEYEMDACNNLYCF